MTTAPRIAHCLDKLRTQINTAHAKRNKASDGWIGDKAHAARASDHNAKRVGNELIVFALDVTHDPEHGVDCGKLAELLILDNRTKYVIFRGRIYNKSVARNWRKYKGQNAHNHHLHISATDASDPDIKDWKIV